MITKIVDVIKAKILGISGNLADVNASNELLNHDADLLSQAADIETAVDAVESAVRDVETNQTDKSQFAKLTDGTNDLDIESDGSMPVTIKSPLESNGAVPVNIQDQHSLALDFRFIQPVDSTTTSANAEPNDMTITLTDTTGYVDGNVVGIFQTGIFYFGRQIGAPAGSVITLDTPIDRQFLSGANSITAIDNMNIDGSGATQIFQVGPTGVGADIDITRIMGFIQDGVTPGMDDSKFGGIAGGLTNGVVLRYNNNVMNNLWNIKTNGEFGLFCYDTAYTANAPAGSEGFRFRNSYGGQSKHGVTIRLEPGDTLELLIQDDLTDLEDFRMLAQGHVVVD